MNSELKRKILASRSKCQHIQGINLLTDDMYIELVLKAEKERGDNNFWHVFENCVVISGKNRQ